jgi:hypothetical protein
MPAVVVGYIVEVLPRADRPPGSKVNVQVSHVPLKKGGAQLYHQAEKDEPHKK